MIVSGTNPVGIDLRIFELQTVLESVLCNNVDTRFNWPSDTVIYGKIQKTVKNGNTIPELYSGNGEYIQPFIDDRVSASLAFVVNSYSLTNRFPIADVDLIITADLVKIFGNQERNTAKAITNIYNAIQGHCLSLGAIKEGINDVFKNFSGIKDYQPSDLSQWFVFSINFKITFDSKLN